MADFYKAAREIVYERGEWQPCCTFVARVLVRTAQLDPDPTYKPGGTWWRDANVWDAERPFSSIEAAAQITHHVTREVPPGARLRDPTPSRLRAHLAVDTWYSIQGWRRSGSGHNFLLQTHPEDNKGGRILESSESKGVRLGAARWDMGADLLPFEYVVDRLTSYQDLGLVRLW